MLCGLETQFNSILAPYRLFRTRFLSLAFPIKHVAEPRFHLPSLRPSKALQVPMSGSQHPNKDSTPPARVRNPGRPAMLMLDKDMRAVKTIQKEVDRKKQQRKTPCH